MSFLDMFPRLYSISFSLLKFSFFFIWVNLQSSFAALCRKKSRFRRKNLQRKGIKEEIILLLNIIRQKRKSRGRKRGEILEKQLNGSSSCRDCGHFWYPAAPRNLSPFSRMNRYPSFFFPDRFWMDPFFSGEKRESDAEGKSKKSFSPSPFLRFVG